MTNNPSITELAAALGGVYRNSATKPGAIAVTPEQFDEFVDAMEEYRALTYVQDINKSLMYVHSRVRVGARALLGTFPDNSKSSKEWQELSEAVEIAEQMLQATRGLVSRIEAKIADNGK